ncbi:MAG: HpaII family restriction endonuclease [Alphaproteobacteria bacterium]|nr:MAG: HpaII family restriction endonuclease [Alphaproteobacteria bacterium]
MSGLRFVDIFAGIGGFHLALHQLGCECVFASEIDPHARKTYRENFYALNPALFDEDRYNEDIRSISPEEIPDFDILCAGFPCQPFSQAGYKRGFADTHASERGNLFFVLADILAAKRPRAFFLENVRGLLTHDNGNTFRIIKHILEEELGYSFYYQIVRACDYGLPQLRPRLFMIGFRDEGMLKSFHFPPPIPLKMTMSDVWDAPCDREIGYTLRVGGRGSAIDDRRNWDAYRVDGTVRQLMPEQGKKMQGFPDDFRFPVSTKEAMKQLGNSVAIDAVRVCAGAMLEHMEHMEKKSVKHHNTMNKGEWTELYTLLKIMYERRLIFANADLEPMTPEQAFDIHTVRTLNTGNAYHLLPDASIMIEENGVQRSVALEELDLSDTAHAIKQGKSTFSLGKLDAIRHQLGISWVKSGTSLQKADIILDCSKDGMGYAHQGFGIKSFLGSKPTLLNASGNTNFVYEVRGLHADVLEEINAISTPHKLIDRVKRIHELGGSLHFHHVEADSLEYNLQLIDSTMPQLLSAMLLEFVMHRRSKISDNLHAVVSSNPNGVIAPNLDHAAYVIRIKRLLMSILLGFFAGKKWDGQYSAQGIIIVKTDGSQYCLHMLDVVQLEEYLFRTIMFDTPSTTRHRYGSLIKEHDGKLYFKLNMQLRF